MKKKLGKIAERRQMLVVQAAEQREALSKNIQPLNNCLSLVDKSLKVMNYFKKHPKLVMGIAVFIGILQPIRAAKWLRHSWIASLALFGLRTWLKKN